MRRVKQGDPLEITAGEYNAFLYAAEQAQIGENGGLDRAGPRRNSGIIKVENVSGSALPRLAAVAITGLISTPNSADFDAQSSAEFFNNPVFTVDVPTLTTLGGRFVILQQPLQNGQIGWAIASGVTPAWVNINNVLDWKVDCVDGSTTLKSGNTKGHDLLWVAGSVGGALSTGNQLAVIRIGDGITWGFFPVLVTKTGGSAGDGTSTCSFVYTVKDLYGNVLDTSMSPKKKRPVGAMIAPADDSYGVGFYDENYTFQLWDANERQDSEACT